MMKPACLLVVAVLLSVACVSTLVAREWVDASGKYRIEAELLVVKDGKIYLEKTDGQIVNVPLTRMSKADVQYLMGLSQYAEYFKANPVPGFEAPAARPVATASTKVATIHVEDESKVGEVRSLGEMGWGVKSLAFSPDGRFLAVGKMDRAVMLFDVDKSQRVAMVEDLEGLGQVTSLAFSPDGRKLLAGGYNGRIQVWDVGAEGTLTEANRFVGHSKEVLTITVSADGRRVLSGGREELVRCWTLDDAREQFVIDGFEGTVKATFITRGGKQGLGCSGDLAVLIDMKKGEAIQTMKLGSTSTQTVAIAPDGSRIVMSNSYALESWGIKTGEKFPTLQDREIQWSATFLPNSKYLLSGGRGKVNLWELATNRKIYEFDMADIFYVQSITCSPDNRHFAAISSTAGRTLKVFRLPAEIAEE